MIIIASTEDKQKDLKQKGHCHLNIFKNNIRGTTRYCYCIKISFKAIVDKTALVDSERDK